MYTGLHIKYPIFLSDFNETLNVLDTFSKSTQISNFMKFRPVTAELFHAASNDEANIPFRNFANAHINLKKATARI
jgi:hypothetical protein